MGGQKQPSEFSAEDARRLRVAAAVEFGSGARLAGRGLNLLRGEMRDFTDRAYTYFRELDLNFQRTAARPKAPAIGGGA